MAIGTDTDPRRTDRRKTLAPGALSESLSRYDLTLLVVPIAFLCALVLNSALPVPTSTALAGAALCGAVVVADALFLNPPTG